MKLVKVPNMPDSKLRYNNSLELVRVDVEELSEVQFIKSKQVSSWPTALEMLNLDTALDQSPSLATTGSFTLSQSTYSS